MKKLLNQLILLLLLLIINSCNTDNFDFGKLSDDITISPEIVAPLASVSFSVWDIIESVNEEDDTLVSIGENDVIKIVYSEDEIYNYEVRELLDLPKEKTLSMSGSEIGDISIGDVSISRSVTLRQITDKVDGEIDQIVALEGLNAPFPATLFDGPAVNYTVETITDFTKIKLSDGALEIKLDNKLEWIAMSMDGELYDNQTGQVIADFSFQNLDPDANEIKTIDLSGKIISNDIIFRMSKFETFASSGFVPINLENFFDLEMSFNNLKITSGNVKTPNQLIEGFKGNFDFSFEEGIEVYQAEISKGELNVSPNINSEITGEIQLTLTEIKVDGSPLKFNIPFDGSSSASLAQSIINFASDAEMPANNIPYEYSITVNESNGYINFNSTDELTLDVILSNMEFQSIQGDFGAKSIDFNNGYFRIDTEFLDRIEGDFRLANPSLQLLFVNSIGIPAEVLANFTATSKEGVTVDMDPDPFRIETPANINADPVQQTISFNKTNSNIVDFIALPPSGDISYFGEINFNPDGMVTQQNPNFFNLNSIMKIGLAVELPFELKVNNLAFSDTVSVNGEGLEMIKSAELIISANNGIPLDIDLQIFFIDTISGQQYSSSAKSKILDAAQVNESGVITKTQSINTFSLNEEELSGLVQANGIAFKGIISSPEDGAKVAALKSENTLDISVAIKSKLEL